VQAEITEAKAAKKSKTAKKVATMRPPPTSGVSTRPLQATPLAQPLQEGGAPVTVVKGVIRSSGKWGRK